MPSLKETVKALPKDPKDASVMCELNINDYF